MVDDKDRAKMVMLSGLNWTNAEIGNHLGLHESTVSDHLNKIEDESKADGAIPEAVFWQYVLADVFDNDFRAMVASRFTK